MSGAMGRHQSAAMGTDTWLTPPEILTELGQFDLDPCAAPDPKPWPTANTHYTLPVDGLAEPWFGRVWLNPPYSREVVRWLRKLSHHGAGTALIFARTETTWFVEAVWGRATGVLFLHGRIHFHHADGTRAKENAGAPSCLVAYGEQDADQLRQCDLPGTYVDLHRAHEIAG
ncbi:DNA N-6-adenine-methyltransferase (Dam) (plasmid) [Mycobacterium sp. THAF192]|nr:DNA N-6-adenine-methyltransferase (Dam) [Mycobacterium sp. THAF192]